MSIILGKFFEHYSLKSTIGRIFSILGQGIRSNLKYIIIPS